MRNLLYFIHLEIITCTCTIYVVYAALELTCIFIQKRFHMGCIVIPGYTIWETSTCLTAAGVLAPFLFHFRLWDNHAEGTPIVGILSTANESWHIKLSVPRCLTNGCAVCVRLWQSPKQGTRQTYLLGKGYSTCLPQYLQT